MINYFFVSKDYDSELFRDVIADFTYPHVYEAGRTSRNMFFYVAADEDAVLGMVVIEISGRIAKLRSVAVVEDRRRERIATSLINGVCKELKKTNVCWMEAMLTDDGEQLKIEENLVKSLYFELLSDDECITTVQLKDCVENEIIKHYLSTHEGVCSYEELDEIEIGLLDKKLHYEGVYSALTDEGISRQYSFFNRAGYRINGCLLESVDDGEVNIDYAYVDPDSKDNLILLKLMGAATQRASQNLPLDTPVHISCINEVSSKLLRKLFSNCESVTRVKKYIKAI